MDLEAKDKYIAEHLMKLQPDTLRYMVADLTAEVERLTAEGRATDFIGYLIDNCEGDCFLSEELLQQWYADFLKAKRAAEAVQP